LATAACGGGSDDEPGAAKTTEPAPDVSLTVQIVDSGGLDIYFNSDGRVCTSSFIRDLLNGVKSPRVAIVVKDADGTTVATQKAPEYGGKFNKGASSCTVPVTLTVPPSDFYEVTVTGGSDPITQTTTVETKGAETTARLAF
jgi:hypothetical protein